MPHLINLIQSPSVILLSVAAETHALNRIFSVSQIKLLLEIRIRLFILKCQILKISAAALKVVVFLIVFLIEILQAFGILSGVFMIFLHRQNEFFPFWSAGIHAGRSEEPDCLKFVVS